MDGKQGRGRRGRARNVIYLLCSKPGGSTPNTGREGREGRESRERRGDGRETGGKVGDEWREEQDALKTGFPSGLLYTQGSRETAINPALGLHAT